MNGLNNMEVLMMGIDHKIEEAKNYFNKMQKSGRNNYQKFDYFEVKDIFPVVREVCKKFKLRSKFDWDPKNDIMTLTLKDLEDGSIDVSTIPVAQVNVADAGKHMQDIGRCQTYAQRYLYIQVFEIAVPDEIDNKDQKKMAKSNPVKKTQTEVEPTEEEIKQAIDAVYDIIVTQGNKEFTIERALFQLRRKYKYKPKLVQACEESLKINQANQVKTQ